MFCHHGKPPSSQPSEMELTPPGGAASPGMGEAWWREFEASYDRSGATPPGLTGATDASLAPLSARRLVRTLSGAGSRDLVVAAKPPPDTGSDKENGGAPRAADSAAPPPPPGVASSPEDSDSSSDSSSSADASPHPASPSSDAPPASPPLPALLPLPPVGGYTPLAAATAAAAAAIAAAAGGGETALEVAAHVPAATAQSSWGSCISHLSEEDSQELWHAMLFDLANIWQARSSSDETRARTPTCSRCTPTDRLPDRHSSTPELLSCESDPTAPYQPPPPPFARPACSPTDL